MNVSVRAEDFQPAH